MPAAITHVCVYVVVVFENASVLLDQTLNKDKTLKLALNPPLHQHYIGNSRPFTLLPFLAVPLAKDFLEYPVLIYYQVVLPGQ